MVLHLQVGKDVMHFRPPDEQNDHKVTCGVNVGVLDKVLDLLNTSLEAAGVVANTITSGTGGWAAECLFDVTCACHGLCNISGCCYGRVVGCSGESCSLSMTAAV